MRIIPARAGFTAIRFPDVIFKDGSSPLARGLRGPRRTGRVRRGIIPARAGFTVRHHDIRVGQWDHPRSRGVYCPRAAGPEPPRGSSPLARGLQHIRRRDRPSRRIIPARAGFTRSRPTRKCEYGDHPRSRGVYIHALIAKGYTPRIIPARAGFTGQSCPSS